MGFEKEGREGDGGFYGVTNFKTLKNTINRYKKTPRILGATAVYPPQKSTLLEYTPPKNQG
jgi:hypothetical protein